MNRDILGGFLVGVMVVALVWSAVGLVGSSGAVADSGPVADNGARLRSEWEDGVMWGCIAMMRGSGLTNLLESAYAERAKAEAMVKAEKRNLEKWRK